jgi:hypothetical protein
MIDSIIFEPYSDIDQGNISRFSTYDYLFGINLVGKVPPQFHIMDPSAPVEGTNVMVLPSRVLSPIFITVTEMAPVPWFTEAELILFRAESARPRLV